MASILAGQIVAAAEAPIHCQRNPHRGRASYKILRWSSQEFVLLKVVLLFLKELDLLVGLAPAAETQVWLLEIQRCTGVTLINQAVLLPFLLRCLELQEPTILNEALLQGLKATQPGLGEGTVSPQEV